MMTPKSPLQMQPRSQASTVSSHHVSPSAGRSISLLRCTAARAARARGRWSPLRSSRRLCRGMRAAAQACAGATGSRRVALACIGLLAAHAVSTEVEPTDWVWTMRGPGFCTAGATFGGSSSYPVIVMMQNFGVPAPSSPLHLRQIVCQVTTRYSPVQQEPAGRNRLRPLGLRTAKDAQSGSQRLQRQRSISAPAAAAARGNEPPPQHDARLEPTEQPADAAAAEAGGEAAPALDADAEPSRPKTSAAAEPAAGEQREPEPSRPQQQHHAAFPPPVHPGSAKISEPSRGQYSVLRRSAPVGMLQRPSRLSKRSSASGGSGGVTTSQEITWLQGLMSPAMGPDATHRNRPDPELMAAYRLHPLQTARSMPAERDFMLSWSLPGQ